MRCQNCGTELEEGSKFCRECGSKVIENKRFCRECGTELPEGAKFCPECGANILPKSSVASPPGGHRTASNNSFNEGINVKPSKGQKRSKRRIILKAVKILALIILAIFLNNLLIVLNCKISGSGMGPTILDGERLIAFRHAYGINLDFLEKDVITVPLVDPERFDIIAFHHPDIGLAISRIIGLPGETIEVREGYVYINGSETPLDEPFIDEGSQWGKRTDIRSQRGDGIYEVPESSYFVMGDYRINSNDSRFWKTNHYLTYDQIIGKVVFRYWPTNMIKWLGSGV